MKITKFLVFSLALAFLAACNNTPDSAKTAQNVNEDKTQTNKAEEDAETLVQASAIDMFEIEAARMATTVATNQSVKDYANMMIQEHTTMSNETKAVAAMKNYSLPMSMPNDKMEKLNEMREWDKNNWDQKYIDAQVEIHEKALEELESRASKTADSDIRAWAQKGASHVRMHLEQARRLDNMLENSDNNNANRVNNPADRNTNSTGNQ